MPSHSRSKGPGLLLLQLLFPAGLLLARFFIPIAIGFQFGAHVIPQLHGIFLGIYVVFSSLDEDSAAVGSLHIISERRVTASSTFNRMHIIAKINQSIRLGWPLMRTDSSRRQVIPTLEHGEVQFPDPCRPFA